MVQSDRLLSRLLFQCRYSGTSVEALVMEVNTVPPPPPVAAPGPLRVELRLANGQCVTKGCAEGNFLSYVCLIHFWISILWLNTGFPQGMRPTRPTTVTLIILSQKSCESLCMLRCALWRELTPKLFWCWDAAGQLQPPVHLVYPNGTFWLMGECNGNV